MLFEVAGVSVQVIKKRVKHINLRIHPNGDVRLSAPHGTPGYVIQRFLQERDEWITHHRTRLHSQSSSSSPTYATGEQHPFLGSFYPLLVCDHAPYQHIQFDGKTLFCFCKGVSSPEQRKSLLDSWYRQQMKELLPNLTSKWENHIGVYPEGYAIRQMKRRWGTCYPKKKLILLSLSLIQKSKSCIEFVIVHELVHLLEASHNKRFYALMTEFMPEWRVYHDELRKGSKNDREMSQ